MRRVIVATIFLFSSLLSPSQGVRRDGHHLHVGFYSRTCSRAEDIVADIAGNAFRIDPGLPAGIIRLFFHDCFVNGCDASLLLDSTPSGEPIEKESRANTGTLKGLDLIDEVKDRLEAECPKTVSCADILAFITREAIVFSGLPRHPFPSGRRDGLASRSQDVSGNIPGTRMHIDDIANIFTRKGMTVEEMVVLIGAHSIGVSQCRFFDYRLHNFSSTQSQDPDMDTTYASYLSSHCPSKSLFRSKEEVAMKEVSFDPMTPFRLDTSVYLRALERRGMLESDHRMAHDPKTKMLVERMAMAPINTWGKKFVRAMIRLSRVDVLTGRNGEIRKNCRAIN